MKKIASLLLLLISINSFATRGYVGNNVVTEVRFVESYGSCGPSSGACLIIYFEGGAMGCLPASNYISIRLTEPNIESIESMVYMSLTSKKKFRTYATRESCKDADAFNINGASLYEVAH